MKKVIVGIMLYIPLLYATGQNSGDDYIKNLIKQHAETWCEKFEDSDVYSQKQMVR